ncbi:MAG: glutathione-dependent reductase [Gammaproteobacteria bacterium]|nr:MAG: glutathione-dependent reductase [Gammaproteobacteria bacterium]
MKNISRDNKSNTSTTENNKGKYIRELSQFRNWVTIDGSAGVTGVDGFKAEAGRYHLYVSYACPWAHRTLIMRQLKGLATLVSLSVVHWHLGEQGWNFNSGAGVIPDSINGAQRLAEIYHKALPEYSARITVPILWDKKQQTIVSNESAEIMRMFNSAFDDVGASEGDYYPQALQAQIEQINALIYEKINNGVYKAGFAKTQAAYEEAVSELFTCLDDLETRLSTQRYLTGTQITEADWRLFTTLLRFDSVYVGHFKCNIRQIKDYPNLWAYSRDLYQQPGVAKTVNMQHIKQHYYGSHHQLNPTGIIPLGPEINFKKAHHRHQLAMTASDR